MNLKDRLLVYKPDVIIQSLGSADMGDDIFLRGGFERFQKNHHQVAPWWEPLYAISYTSRIFFKLAGYTEKLQKYPISASEVSRVNICTEDLFDRYSSLCRANGIRLFIVLHPMVDEVEKGQYYYFAPLLDHLASDKQIKVIDLLPCYRMYIKEHHGIAEQYYWKFDRHHNGTGYKMMAETTWHSIAPFLKDSI